jgi:biotin-dependent carboxylase-like uncharacterized protein
VSADAVTVLDGGALTTVQDPVGRRGYGRFGVPAGGACDPWSARLANRLVGNPDEAALLEATFTGPSLRFDVATPRAVTIAGADLDARLDGVALRPTETRMARPGSVLRCAGRLSGLRAYVAVAGGFAVEALLGSVATDLRSGFGGLEGRPLHDGDRLPIGGGSIRAPARVRPGAHDPVSATLRVVGGPLLDRFAGHAIEDLCAHGWTVSEAADRTGIRLEGDAIRHGPGGAEVGSLGLPAGAIQVPPDGRPIVTLADRPVTGGYAVLACVAQADIGCAAQLATGDTVRFTAVSREEAIEALRRRWAELDALEPVAPDDRDAGWAGAMD